MGYTALATAFSGIASNLLHNGRTVHHRLKVPLKIEQNSFCPISKRSNLAHLLRQSKLLIIDEMSMGHRYVFEAIDRTLRVLRDAPDTLFGGLTVIMSGDWTQIPPVIKRGSKADIIGATLKFSFIYRSSEKTSFSRNLRANSDPSYASYLKSVSIGSNIDVDGKVALPHSTILNVENPQRQDKMLSLCDWVFDGINGNHDPQWLTERAIICPLNEMVDKVNKHVMNRIPGVIHNLKSADSVDENHQLYPTEFLNSLSVSGLPPHNLELKVGAPIMLIRNIDTVKGHCNGSKYIVKEIRPHVISALTMNGPQKGHILFIPRIPMSPSSTTFPFVLTRVQFPIKPCFSITANKSQGQTLRKVGLHLEHKEFFAHGQLNVSLSRVQREDDIKIILPEKTDRTTNVVYKELL